MRVIHYPQKAEDNNLMFEKVNDICEKSPMGYASICNHLLFFALCSSASHASSLSLMNIVKRETTFVSLMKYYFPSPAALIIVVASVLLGHVSGLQQPGGTHRFPTRRTILSLPPKAVIAAATGASSAAVISTSSSSANAATPNGLILNKSSESGLQWADAKRGTGQPLKPGMVASIDYSMASTVGRQPQIYTTKDKGVPYRWTIGDGSTIAVSLFSYCPCHHIASSLKILLTITLIL